MSKVLVPIEQKTVVFYDDEVTAVQMADGVVYVPIRPLCDYLGVDWSSQLQRINRDVVLAEVVQGVVVITTPSEGGRGGGPQDMMCLPLDYLNGWLFGINANRVKPEVREQVIRYQKECYRILADAFVRDREMVVSSPSVLMQVRDMGLAIARMAEEQMEFDRRLAATEGKLEIVGRLEERLTAVEEKLSPGQLVTQDQASQISQAVKAVALTLGKKTGHNEFGAIYGELYRRYGITSYKALPAHKFEDALSFLTEWHQDITTNVPF